jgi:hypothetical protein
MILNRPWLSDIVRVDLDKETAASTLGNRSQSPDISTRFSPTLQEGSPETQIPLLSSGKRPTPVRPPRPTGENANHEAFPEPPPYSNLLGPARMRPYLPYTLYPDGPTIFYSCRPGGEKLYDMLAVLPLDEFGVLSWAVLDRDEEIFEVDDLTDEQKVMHALWARYMFLHRANFIANFLKGAIDFVNKYYRIIHDAAGWLGLRYLLLVSSIVICPNGALSIRPF